jgi:hypothetical protein
MKKSFSFLFLLIFLPFGVLAPLSLTTGCTNTPTTQATKYKTLASVGLAAQGAMDSAAQLLKAGKLTVPQFQKIAAFYDTKFQPAFALARTAAQSDLSSLASPDVTALLAQLTVLLAELSTPPAP